MVRERQVIIRLPNADDMQVKATVNEARVTLVRPGLPVSIRVDALKDEVLEGEVTKVNQYAEAEQLFERQHQEVRDDHQDQESAAGVCAWA